MTTRAEVVAESRTWLRTPFHHHAAIKGVGVDCAHLLRAVYTACGVTIKPIDHYPHDWHMHRSEERFMTFVEEYMDQIDEAKLLPGDAILWKIGRCFSHGAIFIGNGEVIHAVGAYKAVVMSRLDEDDWLTREHRCFGMRL